MAFPIERPRRLRMSSGIRRMVCETRLQIDQLILPFFVVPGEDTATPIDSMPGVFQFSIDRLCDPVREAMDLGIGAVLLFGVPEASDKDASGSAAWADDGIVQQAVKALKAQFPELIVITDVCLCAYTENGHCGLVRDDKILNDPSLELLAKVAVSHAKAGADVIAPSDMLDGRIAVLRKELDGAGFEDRAILSYAVKYASAYYGPFRDAAASAPSFGDRRTHQMDPANRREALREARLDLEEGAELLMVKPALAYLDILADLKAQFDVPVVAYNVSGEFSMIKAAAEKGWVDERAVVLETLTGMIRAGADLIITYHAADVARWLKKD